MGVTGGGQPTVTRGMITIPDRGTSRYFMFNPNDVNDTKGISWGSIEVPGASHPVYQFGAGGERLISFELYMDGDRGRFGRQQQRDTSTLSVKDELYFYRGLIMPRQYGMDMASVFPYTVLFTFGELYQNLPCIVKAAPWKIEYWTPKLQPVRARIALQLAEIVDKSQTADQMFALGGV